MSSLYGSDSIGGVVNVITKKGYNLDNWTGVLEDNYFLQEQSKYGNTNQTNAFLMGPVIPGKLGVSVAADYLDRRDDDSPKKPRFVKHEAGNLDATVSLVANRHPTVGSECDSRPSGKKATIRAAMVLGFDRDAASLSQHAWYGDDLLEVKTSSATKKRAQNIAFQEMSPQFIEQRNFEANSANTFTLGDHKLTLGAKLYA
ncbi:Colicin I receptor precursor [Kluyvera cryocrescens]|uniref:Colicin I receptor n=1 Tax=Kluyvera cryocrescens TaxID=580 RepID=A0A485CT62_KLUCR|nr:Colicin I receptor precursor [Kluyvera cryocrescens]